MLWRVASSDRIHASLDEIETRWSILDLWTAHKVLDLYDRVEEGVR
jgi:hypothetical protein